MVKALKTMKSIFHLLIAIQRSLISITQVGALMLVWISATTVLLQSGCTAPILQRNTRLLDCYCSECYYSVAVQVTFFIFAYIGVLLFGSVKSGCDSAVKIHLGALLIDAGTLPYIAPIQISAYTLQFLHMSRLLKRDHHVNKRLTAWWLQI